MGNDKSLRPNGYTAAFFKEAWDILSTDVTKAVQEFFTNGTLLKELNHTLIALIPKVSSPSRINDYRPISCCNVLFKCITKSISNRIKDSLKTLVSPNQSAFVSRRRISNNILLTQEIMHNYHLDRGPLRCAFKLDIQKAYDTVKWDFLREILVGFGFHHRMIAWIMECVSSTFFSLSINGVLHGFFKGKRGLWQGDPLSPYLFTLIVEVFTLILHRRVHDSGLFTYHRYYSKFKLINLCFADDLFLFAHRDTNSAGLSWSVWMSLKWCQALFLASLRALHISAMCFILAILNILSFDEGRLPVKYLGVLLISSRLIYRDCRELVKKLMRGFLWCQGDLRKGKSKVAWEVVCLPKREGSLGFRRIDVFNKAFMVSHIWVFLTLRESRKFSTFVPSFGNLCGIKLEMVLISILGLIDGVPFALFRILFLRVKSTGWALICPLSSQSPSIVDNGSGLNIGLNQPFSVSLVWESIRPRGDEINWCDVVWFSQCIPPHDFHLWLVIKRKLKTQDNLRQWDNHMKAFAGLPSISFSLDDTVDSVIPISKRRSAGGGFTNDPKVNWYPSFQGCHSDENHFSILRMGHGILVDVCVDIVWKLLVHQICASVVEAAKHQYSFKSYIDVVKPMTLTNHCVDVLSIIFSDSLLLTPLCYDDIHDVTPRVSALAGCDRLVVRISLEGDEILRVQGERTQGVAKTLLNTKEKSYAKFSKCEFWLEEMHFLGHMVNHSVFPWTRKGRVKLRRVRAMSMTIQSSVNDEILATPSETSKVENVPGEMLRDLDQQMKKRADDVKENMVIDALSRKERMKPRRVRAMAMTIHYGEWNSGDDQLRLRWMNYLVVLADATECTLKDMVRAYVIDFGGSYRLSIQCAPFEALYGRKCRSPVLWVDIGESSLTGLELVQETTDKVLAFKFVLISFESCLCISDYLLLTPLCCDDIHDVTPRVSALAIRRDKRKEVHTRLDFGENSRKSQRMREDSQNSSAKTLSARYRNPSKRPQIRDRLRNNDGNVFGQLGRRRQSAFKRLSDTYSPSMTKFGPDREYPRDGSYSRCHPYKRDSSPSRDHSHDIEESCGNTYPSYRTGDKHRYHSHGTGRFSSMKRGRNSESSLSRVERWAMPTWCHVFNSTLIGTTRIWFDELPPESTDRYKDLKAAFFAYFMQQKNYVKDPVEVHNIKQNDGETIEDFMERFKVEPGRMKRAPEWDAEHYTRAWMNFMIVRSPSPFNGIIGRPGIREIQAVPSTAHGMLKFSVAIHPDFPDQEITIERTVSIKARTELCTLLKRNLDIFAWQPSDMTGVPRSIAEHRLNIRERYSPVRQKKRGQTPERAKAIQVEVQKLVEAGIQREVYYHDWLSNPVMVKKHDGNWRMCVDFTDLNKACLQDCYPLSEIDWKVESLCGCPFKCFLNAYKGYHQIQMAEQDEEKTAFHTSHRDIEEMFCTLRRINMKLNPKKCTFGAAVGMFLGYMINPKGIKPCPDKTEAVLQLPSPRTIKEVHSLNGKLASLNRFISKSTPDAEQAFKQLKQHLAKLPMLLAPKPKEEPIMYLSVSYGAISAVLMTERDTVQTPVYFMSRALQAPELNYTPMEKLVLTLFYAAKRLCRYFQAYPIVVITDQPIKQVMSRQILADFLVEKLDDASPEASVIETPQEPWTLFTGGSSCVDRSGAGLILTSPEGIKFTYALRFQFTASNNEADFAHLSKQVLVEVLKEKSIQEKEVATVVEEEGPTWMTPIMEYLKDGTLPDDRNEPWLRCAGPLQVDYVIREIHEGSCSMHAGPQSMIAKAIRSGYYWPTMHRDAQDMICTCNACQVHRPGKVKFLIVAMDYFTKWIEAKAVATITDSQSDGLVERANQSLGEGIKARLSEENKNWIKELPHVLWAHRTLIKSSHGDTPFALAYGTEDVIPPEIRMPMYRTAVVDVIHNNEELQLNLDLLEERRECAAIREAKANLKMTKYYNTRVRGVTFRPEDFVYRSNEASHAIDGGKLGPKWEGPYEVIEALGDGAYMLRSMDGTVLPRMWNVANLKKCYL
nr:hypothetical protein [Tanacetum cinerariifolium]